MIYAPYTKHIIKTVIYNIEKRNKKLEKNWKILKIGREGSN